jgi:hypothetical protein
VSTPAQKQFQVHIASGQTTSNQTVSIPAGKSMIIEHVSGTLFVPSSQVAFVSIQTAAFQIDVPGGTTTGYHFFPTTVVQPGRVVFGQRTYISTIGGNIVLTVQRSDPSGVLDGQVTICGELLP